MPSRPQHFLELRVPAWASRARDEARHGDVVARGEVRQQVELLENEAHGSLAETRAAGVGEGGEVLVGHPHHTRRWAA